MAIKIRLRRTGTTNQACYRIVVSDTRFPRDGRFIESIGYYNPRRSGDDRVELNAERAAHWLKQGAQLSEAVRPLLKVKGVPLPARKTRKKQRAAPPPVAAAEAGA